MKLRKHNEKKEENYLGNHKEKNGLLIDMVQII
jgi:hypothetical protein